MEFRLVRWRYFGVAVGGVVVGVTRSTQRLLLSLELGSTHVEVNVAWEKK